MSMPVCLSVLFKSSREHRCVLVGRMEHITLSNSNTNEYCPRPQHLQVTTASVVCMCVNSAVYQPTREPGTWMIECLYWEAKSNRQGRFMFKPPILIPL